MEVTYICTYINHSLGLEERQYLPLPQSVHKKIQEKFAQGDPGEICAKSETGENHGWYTCMTWIERVYLMNDNIIINM